MEKANDDTNKNKGTTSSKNVIKKNGQLTDLLSTPFESNHLNNKSKEPLKKKNKNQEKERQKSSIPDENSNGILKNLNSSSSVVTEDYVVHRLNTHVVKTTSRTEDLPSTSRQTRMDVDPIVEMMSSTLTEVMMHSEANSWNVVHISSESNKHRRNSKRSQTCISRTVSLNLEVPKKKLSEIDGNLKTCNCLEAEDESVTLSEAITQKYMDNSLLEDIPCTSSIIIVSTPRSSLPATLVLNDCNISTAGELEKIKSLCNCVKELDLAQNKLTDMKEVQKILNMTQHLNFLNLSSNDFSRCEFFPMENLILETMKWLVLNATCIPWETLEGILHFMPNLEELYLSLNGYASIELQEDKPMPNVHLLHISGNPIRNFNDVLRLGWKFPNLETLVMADCQISSFGDENNLGETFEKLQSFNISNNNIDSWEEIDKLRCFPLLADLRLLGQPLLEGYNEKDRRQLIIGRLPNIERLNGSRISEEERQDAERAFIRYYMVSSEDSRPKRYEELVQKHGQLDPLANVDLRPQTIVQVLLRFEDKSKMYPLNVRQTVLNFKASLKEFTGLAPNQMRIFYVDKEMEQHMGPEELKFNSKMMYTYNIRDGDEFLIDKK